MTAFRRDTELEVSCDSPFHTEMDWLERKEDNSAEICKLGLREVTMSYVTYSPHSCLTKMKLHNGRLLSVHHYLHALYSKLEGNKEIRWDLVWMGKPTNRLATII